MPEKEISLTTKRNLARVFQSGGGFAFAPGRPILSPARGKYYANAQKLRDEWLAQFPLLPAAVNIFVQMAASREWTVTGTPRRASKAVDMLNNAAYVDPYGKLYEGWHQFASRRALDWISVGEVGMIVPFLKGGVRGLVQYVDPTEVVFVPEEQTKRRVLKGTTRPVRKMYHYDESKWSNDELFLNQLLPTGRVLTSPLFAAVPTARLLYYIREADMAAVDGRKIRDIYLVADDSMREALADAIASAVALWNGEDPAKHGIPIVSIEKQGGFAAGDKVVDTFARLGLASVPETLNRAEASYAAANEFSGLLGLEMRAWYSDIRGTNRALEEVNESRQRTKGPQFFNRQEQRHINQTGVLGRVLFSYIEEVDVSFQKTRAEVVRTFAEAVAKLREAVGEEVSGQSIITYLQRQGVWLNDYDLIQEVITMDEGPVHTQDMVDRPLEQLIEEQKQREKERRDEIAKEELDAEVQRQDALQTSADSALERFVTALRSLPAPMPVPEYGHVVLDQNGYVVDARRPMYPVALTIAQDEVVEDTDFTELEDDIEDFFDS